MTYFKASIAVILVLLVNFFAAVFGVYAAWRFFDIPMHFAGGLAMGMLGLALFHEGISEIRFRGQFERLLKRWFVYVFVLGFVSLVAVGWEVYEFTLDQIAYGFRQPSIADTMLDFVMGLIGGATSVFVFHRHA